MTTSRKKIRLSELQEVCERFVDCYSNPKDVGFTAKYKEVYYLIECLVGNSSSMLSTVMLASLLWEDKSSKSARGIDYKQVYEFFRLNNYEIIEDTDGILV